MPNTFVPAAVPGLPPSSNESPEIERERMRAFMEAALAALIEAQRCTAALRAARKVASHD